MAWSTEDDILAAIRGIQRIKLEFAVRGGEAVAFAERVLSGSLELRVIGFFGGGEAATSILKDLQGSYTGISLVNIIQDPTLGGGYG